MKCRRTLAPAGRAEKMDVLDRTIVVSVLALLLPDRFARPLKRPEIPEF